MSDDAHDAVVIGAGLGGLACAVRMARGGASVLVVEEQARAGGCAGAFRRGELELELSLHLMDAVGPGGPNRAVLEELGIADDLRLLQPAVLRREIWPEHDLRIQHGIEPWRELVLRHFPAEAAGVAELLRIARHAHDEYQAAAEAEAEASLPAHLSPELRRLSSLTASEIIDPLLRDRRLRAMLDLFARSWLGLGLDTLAAAPFLVPWYSYQAFGGSYPEGGSAALVRALERELGARGGELLLGCAVRRILVERRRARGVELDGGRRLSSPLVISNASPLCTLTELVEPRQLDARYRARLARFEPSPSCFKLWLGLGPTPSASLQSDYDVHLCPSYESSADPLDPWQAPISVVRPACLDPAQASTEHEPVSITMLVPARAWAHARADRPMLRGQVGDSLLERVERQLVPGMRAAIAIQEVATPSTFARRINSPLGSIYGWHTRRGRTEGWRLGHTTPIDGLWLVGAWTPPGAGITSVLRSGCRTGRALLGRQIRHS